jgi:hypothetical protein
MRDPRSMQTTLLRGQVPQHLRPRCAVPHPESVHEGKQRERDHLTGMDPMPMLHPQAGLSPCGAVIRERVPDARKADRARVTRQEGGQRCPLIPPSDARPKMEAPMADRLTPSRRRTDDPRHPVRVPATLENSLGADPPRLGWITDLSRSGLALRLFEAPAPGTRVRVTIRLPGRSAFACQGWVAWVKQRSSAGPWLVGVAFHDELNEDLVAHIASEHSAMGAEARLLRR